jgi:hypothetical protein
MYFAILSQGMETELVKLKQLLGQIGAILRRINIAN